VDTTVDSASVRRPALWELAQAVRQVQVFKYISNAWAPTMRMSVQNFRTLRRWSEDETDQFFGGISHALRLDEEDKGSLANPRSQDEPMKQPQYTVPIS